VVGAEKKHNVWLEQKRKRKGLKKETEEREKENKIKFIVHI
jgi:hypothetical protein